MKAIMDDNENFHLRSTYPTSKFHFSTITIDKLSVIVDLDVVEYSLGRLTVAIPAALVAATATTINVSAHLMHRRLGHGSSARMRLLRYTYQPDKYHDCIMEKQTRKPFPIVLYSSSSPEELAPSRRAPSWKPLVNLRTDGVGNTKGKRFKLLPLSSPNGASVMTRLPLSSSSNGCDFMWFLLALEAWNHPLETSARGGLVPVDVDQSLRLTVLPGRKDWQRLLVVLVLHTGITHCQL
jgi:hypothetical protein